MPDITPKEFIENNPLILLIKKEYANRILSILNQVELHHKIQWQQTKQEDDNTILFKIYGCDSNFGMAYYAIGAIMAETFSDKLREIFSNPNPSL